MQNGRLATAAEEFAGIAAFLTIGIPAISAASWRFCGTVADLNPPGWLL
jgi:hypothetical protein